MRGKLIQINSELYKLELLYNVQIIIANLKYNYTKNLENFFSFLVVCKK